jgi:hypothetical protein
MTLAVTSSTDLLQVGKGIAVFKKEGETTFRDLGNCPEIELTPSADNLDHFNARTGTKTKNKTIVISSSCELRVVMEEMAAFNLSLLLTGSIDESDPEVPVVNIGGQNAVRGEFRFYGMNDVGPKWNVTIPTVDFLPSGKLNLISDEWGNFEVTGQMAANDSGVFGTMTPRELNGWIDFHSRERSIDLALLLRVVSTGMSGNSKAITELMEELIKHGS